MFTLKTLHPGGIRTRVFLFLRWMRCPLRQADARAPENSLAASLWHQLRSLILLRFCISNYEYSIGHKQAGLSANHLSSSPSFRVTRLCIYTRVARFFLVQTYQNVKNVPNNHKLHQKDIIMYTKWL
jgi:hypothetical protein